MNRDCKGCWLYSVSALILLVILRLTKSDLPSVVKIGAIFDTNGAELEKALFNAVELVNGDIRLLKTSRLEAHARRIEREDSFHAQKAVCSLLEEGVVAILGPSSAAASALVRSAAEAFHVPHIQTGPDLWPSVTENYTISIYPHLPTLGRGYLDLVSAFGWKTYTLIFEDTESILSQQELLKSATNEGVKVTLRQLLPGQPYRKLLKDIGGKGETNLVLDVPIQKMQSVLKDAQDVGLMTEYHNYFIANLDAHTLNLAEFQHGRTNISSFRLVDPSRMGLSGFLSDREPHYRRKPQKHELLKTQTALVGDGVRLISRALHDLSSTQISKNVQYASCQHPRPWLLGYPLINHMKMIQVRGLTGTVKVDPRGQRTEFNVDVVELKREGFIKIGMWNVNAGIRFTQDYSSVYREVLDSLKNSTLRISTILNPPFAMLKATEDKLVGNDKYEGFCIDLLHEISKMYSFKYEIRLVRDSSYGSVNDKGDWNGMIRELIDREADLAVADLTITYNREEAIDFTMPFMNLGISILYKKPSKKIPRLFSFLAPLSIEVWLYIVAAYVTVSLFLFFLARISPYEWVKPAQCSASTNVLENHFTLLNSLWFTIGSLMQQGSADISPRALSTRILAGIWGFFTLIMISSYTANLAAFLTIERMKTPIENAEDLIKQTVVQYGTVDSGSTQAFFKDSKVSTYKQMWSVMESASPTVFTKTIAEGVERVKTGKYAFLMESTAIEYIIQTECDLIQVGGLLDAKGYGIATPTGSPYTVPLSSAILKLQENGVLHALKERWWRQRGGKKCIQEEKQPVDTTNELSLAKVGGVFVLLLAGLGLACVLAIVEFVCKTKSMLNRKRKEELSAR